MADLSVKSFLLFFDRLILSLLFFILAIKHNEKTMQLQEKYINLLTDFGFKRVFGTEANKDLLQHFINLTLPEKHKVKELKYSDKEKIGTQSDERKAIFDIYCTTVQGEKIIVELQKTKQEYFKDRSIFYSSDIIRSQAPQGVWDFQLTPIYTISILDFVFQEQIKISNYIHKVQLRDEQGYVFYDKLHYIYIELPKFKKRLEDLETELDKWLFIIKRLHELKNRPKILKDPIFDKIFQTAEIANYSKMERNQYQESLKYHRDLVNSLNYAEKQGIEKGIEKGIETTQLAIVKNCVEEGFTLKQISKITSISIDDLKKIIEKQGWKKIE